MQAISSFMPENYPMGAYEGRMRREVVPAARWLKTWYAVVDLYCCCFLLLLLLFCLGFRLTSGFFALHPTEMGASFVSDSSL